MPVCCTCNISRRCRNCVSRMEGNATDASHREADDVRMKIHGESQITTIILRIQGCSGPSGIDASGWHRMCTSFSKASSDLCNNIVMMARRICTEYVDPEVLSSFTACKLIALDKNPGARPIGCQENYCEGCPSTTQGRCTVCNRVLTAMCRTGMWE